MTDFVILYGCFNIIPRSNFEILYEIHYPFKSGIFALYAKFKRKLNLVLCINTHKNVLNNCHRLLTELSTTCATLNFEMHTN